MRRRIDLDVQGSPQGDTYSRGVRNCGLAIVHECSPAGSSVSVTRVFILIADIPLSLVAEIQNGTLSPAALSCRSAAVKIHQLPVPYKVPFCTPVPALSLIFNVVEYDPAVGGERFTLLVQVPDGASVLPKVVLWIPKAALLVLIPLIVTVPPALLLGLVTVTILSGLVVPCVTLPNWVAPGESVNAASVPVPLSVVAGTVLA